MDSWIVRAKETLVEIIDNVQSEIKNELQDGESFNVKISFIGYRDIETKEGRFEVLPFTENVESVKEFINSVEAEGGEDCAEDVQGGLKLMLQQDWTEEAVKKVFLICDAPGHGNDINGGCSDHYRRGSPDGLKLQDLMKECKDKEIEFNFIKLDEACDAMVKVMQECHDELEVKDMSEQIPQSPDSARMAHLRRTIRFGDDSEDEEYDHCMALDSRKTKADTDAHYSAFASGSIAKSVKRRIMSTRL